MNKILCSTGAVTGKVKEMKMNRLRHTICLIWIVM